ncbi:MAG: hypothetical protein D6718_06045 [Acidobacteria bacterium]|nr:MAG: hypothetical protein D6718_06045 [Acidobacteriota bacterium]
MVAPSWGPEGIDPSPVALARELADAGYPPARAWFVDLTSLRAGERSWAADVVAVADDAAGAELLARFVLGSRAAGRLEDWRSIAREIGLRPASVRWVRRAVIDRLRGRQGVPATGSAPSD